VENIVGSKDITIVGAGIVGLLCGIFLRKEGFGVTLIERGAIGNRYTHWFLVKKDANTVNPYKFVTSFGAYVQRLGGRCADFCNWRCSLDAFCCSVYALRGNY